MLIWSCNIELSTAATRVHDSLWKDVHEVAQGIENERKCGFTFLNISALNHSSRHYCNPIRQAPYGDVADP